MKVSVVIPCHNGFEDTRACVTLLRAQQPELEIIVVDNGSKQDLGPLAREIDGLRLLRLPRNLGFAGGVNRGLQAAGGKFLMVLNNDTLPAPRMLDHLLKTLRSDGRIGMAAPVSNFVKGPARLELGDIGRSAEGRAEIEAALAKSGAPRLQDVDSLAGLCLLFRRELWHRVGPFDERFGSGNYEDDDFCLRARLLGYRLVLVRDAFVHHHGHRTFRALGLDPQEEIEARRKLFIEKWKRDPAGAATVSRLMGDEAGAARLAVAGLACHPSWPDGQMMLARHASTERRHDEAIARLQAFLQTCPRHPEGRVLLALNHLRAGREEQGRRLLGQALARCHIEDGVLVNTLALFVRWCLEVGKPQEAEDTVRTALEIAPEDGELHNLLGVSLMQAGALDRAAEPLLRACTLGNPHARGNLGICEWRLGRHSQALGTLARAVADHPDDQQTRSNLDRVLSQCREAGIGVDRLQNLLG